MSRNLLSSAITYLESASEVRIAYLVRLELSESTEASKSYIYLTSYQSDITWDNKTYQSGKITEVGSLKQTQGLTNYKLTVSVAGEFQEELDRGLVENLDKSYVGKEVEILLAYLDTGGNVIPMDASTNGPMQYFIGDITDINITESVIQGTSTVAWSCAGKFQDFELVNGRVTDDAAHRGLVSDEDGAVTPSTGAKKVAYQTDRGFQHANQTINVATKYTTTETRYKLKKSWGGLKTKLKSYEAEVERTLELGVDLAASYLPKVYGVRKVAGIPVFIDTLKSNPSTVIVVYAISCGEIDSFLNLYLDGQSIICSSTADQDNRLCLGNQANGDTLSAFISDASTTDWDAYVNQWPSVHISGERYEDINLFPITPIRPNSFSRTRTEGTSHEDYFTITDESGNRWLQVFHGTEDQSACSRLVSYAAANNFNLQADWATNTGNPASEYWDADCKLLDTAYIVMEMVVSEEESTIPELEAVVSGTLVSTFDDQLNESTKQYSLNPVWQFLDYMIDPIVGGGLDPSLVDYQSFYDVASIYNQLTTSYGDDYLTYWRYLGWKDEPGTNVTDIDGEDHDNQKTRLQTNVAFRTEDTVTKNLEGLLKQFDGTINILGGKYHLSVEDNSTPIADLTAADIKGSIRTKDLSNKDKWNSIRASIQDPGQGWNSTQINFFNSEYLAKDNGIPKKGNVTFNYITNYYTGREWAQIQLAKSRFSRQITFTTYYKYMYLYPNAIVTFTYDRFGYDQKVFRVQSTSLNKDGTIELTLEDFDPATIVGSIDNSGEATTTIPEVLPPQNLEFLSLPSSRFPTIDSELAQDTNGLLLWTAPEGASILNYQVLSWKATEQLEYSVLPTSTITDDNGDTFVFLKIDDLEEDETYTFKVRGTSFNGKTSKYSVVQFNTDSGLPDPVSFSPVTGFNSPNSDDEGYFTGTEVEMEWDTHTNSKVTKYQIEIFDGSGSTSLRLETENNTLPNTYTYTLGSNIQDYATANSNSVGAYRSIQARIRATNSAATDSASFVVSPWTYLI